MKLPNHTLQSQNTLDFQLNEENCIISNIGELEHANFPCQSKYQERYS